MRILIICFLLFFWIINGCVYDSRIIIEAENAVFSPMNNEVSSGIMVISDFREGPIWYRLKKDSPVEIIANTPDISMHRVWQIEISPSDTYLAVLSESEGHPVVDVFEMKHVFIPEESGLGGIVRPLLSVDPYPGTIGIKGWQNDGILILESDMPLTLTDKKLRRVFNEAPYMETQQFLWDVSADSIKRK